MRDRLRFFLNRLGERLWVKPLFMCVLSVAGAFLAKSADYTMLGQYLPDVTAESVDTLLTIISSSMLVIATFAVASMVSAYASASSTATPRSLPLVIADDVSQNALSAFIGAFIFSIVSIIALQNSFYDKAGRFTLFALTIVVFAIVILTFVRWVDRVARLGRLENTVDKVEAAATKALLQRRRFPTMGGVPVAGRQAGSTAIFSEHVGYVQRVDLKALQAYAEDKKLRIELTALPGTFAAPGRSLAFAIGDTGEPADFDSDKIAGNFLIGDHRTYDEDPRFGFIALAEIASRALSPAVNDPGTAIDVIGTLVRLFTSWFEPLDESEKQKPKYDRVAVPEISTEDLLTDAFNPIARDGASVIEVVLRLQKAFNSLSSLNDSELQELAKSHAGLALERAELALDFAPDVQLARNTASFATDR